MLTGSNRLDAILCDAVEIDSIAERKAYLDGACGSDAELRCRVEELIALHFSAGDFLEKPAVAVATTALAPPV